jgi:hypothetical protein
MVKSEMSDMEDNSSKESSNPPSPMIEVVDDQLDNKSNGSDRGHPADHQVPISSTFYRQLLYQMYRFTLIFLAHFVKRTA